MVRSCEWELSGHPPETRRRNLPQSIYNALCHHGHRHAELLSNDQELAWVALPVVSRVEKLPGLSLVFFDEIPVGDIIQAIQT